ncbi:MAG TPA: serine/threonine-protein kinase [Armatimonadota bacterium]|nr:serine/threonine-protein kinase [Armatimonadota bacterium]
MNIPTTDDPITAAWYGGQQTGTTGPTGAGPWATSSGEDTAAAGAGFSPLFPAARPTPGGLARGSTVAGRYRVEQVLGMGAFAVVHAAWDLSLRRWVAIKLYDASAAGGISNAEVQLQASCQHPNLMPLHDAGADARLGVVFLVMPLYPGADLAAALRRYGPMPFRTAILCVDQVCSALHFLWQQRQVFHGDVKPANIWLTGSGAALLMDFNLHGLLARGACLRAGTPGFTAPEALDGRPESRSDVFSLGCVLYTCLAGAPPFGDDAAVRAGRFVPLRQARPDIRPELEAVVNTALSSSPESRFGSPRELQTALRCPRQIMPATFSHSAIRLAGEGVELACWLLGDVGRAAARMVSGAGRLLDRFVRHAIRHPLAALLETCVVWVVLSSALRVGDAWIHLHLTLAIALGAALPALRLARSLRRFRQRRRWRPGRP